MFFFFNDNKNPVLKGNIGEWSEIYVFLRLLSTGKLDVADDKLVAVPNEFYKILAILRKENNSENEYLRAEDVIRIRVISKETRNVEEFQMSVQQFADAANALLEHLKRLPGKRTEAYPDIQEFMEELKIYSIKDVGHKRDITISIEDYRNHMEQTLGFSIKSYLGKSSTLFNPGAGTNFIYRIDFPDGVSLDCDKFNRETYIDKKGKISNRLARIADMGGIISFDHIQSHCLCQNLRTIDSSMPIILANALLIKYQYKLIDWHDIVDKLNELNPLDFRISEDSPVYEYKIKRFLQDAAMGMTPETPWNGTYDANGGQIVVKKDGDIVCYHVYELNRYLNFLFNETRLEQASTSEDEDNPGHIRINPEKGKPNKPYLFGWVYEEDGKYFIKINLQVRFKDEVQKRRKK